MPKLQLELYNPSPAASPSPRASRRWPLLTRWANQLSDFTMACGGVRLLIANFNHLFWYFPESDEYRTIHENAGRYYGVATRGWSQRTLFAISRPDQESDDHLLEVDQHTGQVLRRHQLASRDTHQMIRERDRLLVTDSFRGRLLVYTLPQLELTRIYGGFTFENHVNSVRAIGADLFLLCHNFGKSELFQIDSVSGTVFDRYEDVGKCSHDIVPWEDCFLVCDSANGGLLQVDRGTKQSQTLWSDANHFTKGLTIHQNIAFFGVSPLAERQDRYTVPCDLVAFDLHAQKAIWRRPMRFPGLVNSVSTHRVLERERCGWATRSNVEMPRHQPMAAAEPATFRRAA